MAIKVKVPRVISVPTSTERKLYFDNNKVEDLLLRYAWTGCTQVKLRDNIMAHAGELINQIILAHGLHRIYPGHEESATGDLYQTAWIQIERTLYKYKAKPHCASCYSLIRPQDSALYNPKDNEFGILRPEEVALRKLVCPNCGMIPEVIIYRGCSKVFNMWCVRPDTMIFTTNGIDQIKNVVNRDNYDDKQEIWTLGLNGPRKIVAAVSKPKQPVVDITTRCGYKIGCTKEHSIMRLDGMGQQWIKAGDVKVGDLVGIQYNQQFFVGDDDISGIKLNNLIDEQYRFLIDNTKHMTPAIARACGLSITKSIPNCLLRLSRENIIALINGIFDKSKHKYLSPSKLLIDQLRMLLLNLGVLTKTRINKLNHGRHKRLSYQLTWRGQFNNTGLKTVWLPVTKIEDSVSPVYEISVESNDHSYIANGIISHNSQVARTVILAYIKKESRDHKNADTYKDHLDRKDEPGSGVMVRFAEEATEICKHNRNHVAILDALKHIVIIDDRPAEGIIGKLVRYSGQSRAQVSSFLKMIRLRSDEFTDSPINERPKPRHTYYQEQPE